MENYLDIENELDGLTKNQLIKVALKVLEERISLRNYLTYLYSESEKIESYAEETFDKKKSKTDLQWIDVKIIKEEVLEVMKEIETLYKEVERYQSQEGNSKKVEEPEAYYDCSYIESWETEAEFHNNGDFVGLAKYYINILEQGKGDEGTVYHLARTYNILNMPIFTFELLLPYLERVEVDINIMLEGIEAMARLNIPLDVVKWHIKPKVRYLTKEFIDEIYEEAKQHKVCVYDILIWEVTGNIKTDVYSWFTEKELGEVLLKDGRFVIEDGEIQLKK